MRVLVFGDSITQGYWAVEHGWVDRIRKYYSEIQFAKDEYHGIFNLGVDADNSEDILNRIEAEITARTRPHHKVKPIVVIQIGVNDGSLEPIEPQVAIEQYRKNLEEITAKVKPLSSQIVFVGLSACVEPKTTPVSWGEYYYTNIAIKKHEDCMGEVAKKLDVNFVPVFDQFKAKLDKGNELLPDGLHPNDAGHDLIYQIVKPKFQELLK